MKGPSGKVMSQFGTPKQGRDMKPSCESWRIVRKEAALSLCVPERDQKTRCSELQNHVLAVLNRDGKSNPELRLFPAAVFLAENDKCKIFIVRI